MNSAIINIELFLQKNSFTIFIFLLSFFGRFQVIYAQSDDIKFEQLSIIQGLSDNRVEAICQDRSGFMWFGTDGGLNRYDGYNFINYGHISFSTGATIFEDRHGSLWLTQSVNGELYRFDRIKEKFIHYANIGSSAHQVFEDHDGGIWIATWQNGLAKYIPESDSFKIYRNIPEKKSSLPNNCVQALFEDKSRNLWIGSVDGIYLLDTATDHFIRWKSELNAKALTFCEDRKGVLWVGTSDGLFRINQSRTSFERYRNSAGQKNEVQYIFEDSKNRLWTGNSGSISQFNRQQFKFINYKDTRTNSGLTNTGPTWALYPISEDNKGILWTGINLILRWFDEKDQNFKYYTDYSLQFVVTCSIYKDKSGVIWIGSMKDGVYRYDASRKPFMNVWSSPTINSFLTKNKLSPSVISLFKDKSGILWIGKPDGLLRLDESSGSVKLYTHNLADSRTLSYSGICSIAEESPNILWLSSFEGGLNRFDKTTGKCIRYLHDPGNPKSLNQNDISKVLIDKSGTVWACAGLTLDKFNAADGTFTHYSDSINKSWIITIFEDKAGTLWVATNKGLASFERNSGTFKYHFNNSANSKSLINSDANVIYEDKPGNLWISTGIGLDKLDRKSGIFTHIAGNLPDRIIGILEDDNDVLWLLTSRGISTYNRVTGSIKNYEKSDGIDLSSSIYYPYLKDNSGEMYFGGFNGFIKFHPDSILDNPIIPPVVITSFQVFNNEVMLDSTISEKKLIRLADSRNSISFEFAALNYSLSQKNQYAYKMEGVDKDWVFSDTRRFASYPNLQPGKYIFRVKGSNNDGVWNKTGTSITIIIAPPWWKTWFAYFLYLVFFLCTLYGLRRYEMNRLSFKNQVTMDAAVLKEKEETDKLKSRFFANISHEFRTPLTLILGPAEKIISGSSDDIRKDANTIKRNSRRLLQLINQLLDLSRLEAGKLKLEASAGNIVSFVKGVALSFESLSESRDITLKLHPEKEFIELYFDKEKMMQILTNILSNAFKFTPEEGNITVSVRETEHKSVEIKIRDTGIGISEEEIPKLFDRFYQVDSSRTREFEGTGIGLALTKELVELHHGSIHVESSKSESGSGFTEFTIQLPLGRNHLKDDETIKQEEKAIEPKILIQGEGLPFPYRDTGKAGADQEMVPQEIPEEKTIVLVVEDNYEMREYIKESLARNYIIEEAINGEQGVRKAEKIIPDLIITDLMMPKMDGNELVRILKNDELTSHIPIILLTARAEHEDKLDGLETGADDYLTKPFDLKELQVRVKNLINIRKKLQEKYSRFENMVPEIKEQKLSSIDVKFMLRVGQVIDKHISEEEFNIEEFCSEVAMSRTQLHRKLKALTGKSASLYIRSVKLVRAKKMIEEHQATISEIAYSVGFSSPVYFTRCFREEFGYTPSELKK